MNLLGRGRDPVDPEVEGDFGAARGGEDEPMAALEVQAGLGPILRMWRERRRVSQLALALDAGVSARHLSFIETGRSIPGREVLLRITECLTDVLAIPYEMRYLSDKSSRH